MSLSVIGGAALKVLAPILAKKVAERFNVPGEIAARATKVLLEPARADIEAEGPGPIDGMRADDIEGHVDAFLDSRADLARAALEIAKGDQTSEDPFIRRTRPLITRGVFVLIVWLIVGVPLASQAPGLRELGTDTMALIAAVPAGLWALLSLGVGLWPASRGVERVVGKWQRGAP